MERTKYLMDENGRGGFYLRYDIHITEHIIDIRLD